MDEKQHFRNCCKELGIDCDTYIKLGAGNPKNPTRFIFQSDHTKRKDTQLFAVKCLYCVEFERKRGQR